MAYNLVQRRTEFFIFFQTTRWLQNWIIKLFPKSFFLRRMAPQAEKTSQKEFCNYLNKSLAKQK